MQPNFPSMIYSTSCSCRALHIAGPTPISSTLPLSSSTLIFFPLSLLIPSLSPALSPIFDHSPSNFSSPFHLLPFLIFFASSDLHFFCFSYLHLPSPIPLLILCVKSFFFLIKSIFISYLLPLIFLMFLVLLLFIEMPPS